MVNPSLDKTNPDTSYIHQESDRSLETDPERLGMTDEEYEAQKNQPGFNGLEAEDRDMSDDLSDETTILTYEETNINIPDDALEAARNRDLANPNSPFYPDEFVLAHSDNPETLHDMMDNFDAIEELEGGGVASNFDNPLGEDATEETQPLANEDEGHSERPA